MTDPTAIFSCRYHLTLQEAQEGFAVATFGKRKLATFIAPLVSLAIIIWGFSLGLDGVGKFYVIFGLIFLIFQLLLRFVFLPKLFERQYTRHKLGELEQGIDLYQDYGILIANDRQQKFDYSDVQKFTVGKRSYMLELRSQMVVVISKDAITKTGQQDFFESVFKRYR